MRPLGLFMVFMFSVTAQALDSSVEGVWLNEKRDGYIEIARVRDAYRGTIVGSPNGERDAGRTDERNQNPALRTRALLGLVIIDELVYAGKNRWRGGWIYDPDAGKTYRCRLTLNDKDTLEVRGYVGSPLFGRSQIWTRKLGENA